MIVKITLNGTQLAHGNNLTEALEMLVAEGNQIHHDTVKALFDGKEPVTDAVGTWDIVREPAMTGEMVRAACESGESFVSVTMDMEGY